MSLGASPAASRIAPIDAAEIDGRAAEILDERSRAGSDGPGDGSRPLVAARLRRPQPGDEAIAEVVGLVSLQLLTGSFNLLAGLHREEEATA
jgi:hypothetical protein